MAELLNKKEFIYQSTENPIRRQSGGVVQDNGNWTTIKTKC